MIGLEDTLKLFDESKIQYFDDAHTFAYCPFTNRIEQINLGIMGKKAKVLIFDTRTGYINGTVLVDEFKDDETKRFSDFTKSRQYKEALAVIENTELNKQVTVNQKYYKLPCYDAKNKYFAATYLIRDSAKTFGFSGVYVHPSMLIHILAWSNVKLATVLSSFVLISFLHEGVNEDTTIGLRVDLETDDFYTNLDVKNEFIKKLDANPNEPINSPKFDVVQYNKSLSYINDLKAEIKVPRKVAVTSSNVKQAMLLVRHYDTEGQFAYGSPTAKLSLQLVNESDIGQYLTKFNKQYPQTQVDIEYGIIRYETEVIYKILSLKNVIPDFDTKFVSIYDEQIDMWIERIKNKSYICTSDVENVIGALSEFCSDWQDV